ncbi:MAG: serine hydrolase domain-containing protein [Bacteroidota bacterium]
MKKNQLTFVSVLLFTVFSLISCKKESAIDPNQPFIDQLKLAADSVIQNTQVPGLVALVVDHKRGIDWLYAAGVSNKETNAPMDVNHTFRIASNTKTFTGTVLLQLVDEGKIRLNDKLSKYFPLYPKADSITIKMLCNMTSGIYAYEIEEWTNAVKANPLRVWAPHEFADFAFSQPFFFSPGTGWQYANTNTIILGMIIEQVTGNTLESEITNRIIKPLKFTNTAFHTSGSDLPGNHGRGYDFEQLEVTGDVTESYDFSMMWAAGAVHSTPRELQTYIEELVKGRFLSDTLQQRRLNDMITTSPISKYGLCLANLTSFYGHNGEVWGYTSSMWHSIKHDCTIIIYYNCDRMSTHNPDNLAGKFLIILYGSLDG